ncbi:hypothetical protein [Thiobacillus sp.]|uniref:hypothetical protein n=1 Tax=Thiobacillus sp. TaxID=924 RepID=UPI00286E2EAA|nr:hypothetical protein [Thiobacillus sp.]
MLQVFQILDTGSRQFLGPIEFVQSKQSLGFKRFTFLQVYLICTYRLARSFPKRNALGTRMHEDGTTGSQDRQNIQFEGARQRARTEPLNSASSLSALHQSGFPV